MLILFLFISSPISSTAIDFSQTPPPNLEFSPQQNYVIRLINYNPDITDLQVIKSNLPITVEQPYHSYSISYDIDFANSAYEQKINDFINTISEADWTSKLNQTALQEQKKIFERKDIFEKKNGTAIQAKQLEKFLDDNRPSTTLPDNNRFYIFVFNLSRMDIEGSHWLNVSDTNIDSGKTRFWWRLEWDYPLNYDTKFPYAAFTEISDIAILDPTSFQWYLTWRMIWNKDTNAHPTYNHTLTELLQTKSTLSEQSNLVEDTITTWINDWLSQIFNIFTFPIDLGISVDIQFVTIYDSTQKTKSELEWIINNQMIEETTNFILHTNELSVSTTFIDRQEDNFIDNYLKNKEVEYGNFQPSNSPFQNWTYYDGNSIWIDTNHPNSSIRNDYFSTTDKKIGIHGVILLLDNASYVGHENWIPWTGGLYTGLGGNKTVTILWELDRAFMPDGVSHKAGLSKILIHEIGHAIGFPHPFSNTFISDFANDVMGYYPTIANFSQIISSIFFRTSADSLIIDVQEYYQTAYEELIFEDAVKLQQYVDEYENAVEHHKIKHYFKAWQILRNLMDDLESILKSTTQTSTRLSFIAFQSGFNVILLVIYSKKKNNS